MNGILYVDKPQGWTSHDVVAKLRGVSGQKRVGHSGTLDPLATGLLAVFFGPATKAVSFSEAAEKEYIAHLRLGMETDTQDITGTILRVYDKIPDRTDLEAILPQFCGEIEQIPPMYSAIKVQGQKLYEIARRGGEIAREPRHISIRSMELLGTENSDYVLRIRCSKGTYIRTLCHDIGRALGCGGVMTALRRTMLGNVSVDDACSMDELCAMERSDFSALLLPTDTLFSQYDAVTLSAEDEAHCRNGRSFSLSVPNGTYRLYGEHGVFLMLAAVDSGSVTAIKRFH